MPDENSIQVIELISQLGIDGLLVVILWKVWNYTRDVIARIRELQTEHSIQIAALTERYIADLKQANERHIEELRSILLSEIQDQRLYDARLKAQRFADTKPIPPSDK